MLLHLSEHLLNPLLNPLLDNLSDERDEKRHATNGATNDERRETHDATCVKNYHTSHLNCFNAGFPAVGK